MTHECLRSVKPLVEEFIRKVFSIDGWMDRWFRRDRYSYEHVHYVVYMVSKVGTTYATLPPNTFEKKVFRHEKEKKKKKKKSVNTVW